MIRICDNMGQGEQGACPETFLHIWVLGLTLRYGSCMLSATGLISHFSSNFVSWEHLKCFCRSILYDLKDLITFLAATSVSFLLICFEEVEVKYTFVFHIVFVQDHILQNALFPLLFLERKVLWKLFLFEYRIVLLFRTYFEIFWV